LAHKNGEVSSQIETYISFLSGHSSGRDLKVIYLGENNMAKRIFTVTDKNDLERCYPVMKELRPHLSYEDYISIYEESKAADGYQIVAIEQDDKILAVMGYRFLSDYVRDKHVYVDDLVSTESSRSQGLGAELLEFAEDIARKNNCKSLRLCTGIENERGIKFYDRNGWTKRAYAFSKKLN
jgi:GNAT superfamily N-acetyltransferase